MTQVPSSEIPAPMEGHGAYNRSSRVQAAGITAALPLLEQAARTVPIESSGHAVVLADYGSSQGHNSLPPIAAAIGALRERLAPNRAISVVHTDLPDNDFGALFHTLETDPASYLRRDSAAFASAVGRSFYGQILPSDSVTLGWSSWAVQWLSRRPAAIPDHVQVAYSRDPAARAAYGRQAAADWEAFLAGRGRELTPGGRLVVLTMALDESGDFGYRPLLDALYATLIELVEDGSLSREEVSRMAIPTVARSRANLLAPFVEDASFAGLSVELVEVFLGEDRIWSDLERDGDSGAFGARWAAFCRASVFPTLASSLEGGRDGPRAARFEERLEAGIAARLAAAPQPMIIPLARLLLAKNRG
jgi:SAM dependent carboxyl methyltransferase